MQQERSRRRDAPVYRLVRALVKRFYPKVCLSEVGNCPDAPFVAVGNHAQMNGPIACELYFPGKKKIWCNQEMMHLREVPAYAYQDFWSQKPRATRPFWRLVSYLIAPLSVCVFNNADCIGVYRDMRILRTMRESVEALRKGECLVIFPEHDAPVNPILCAFQDRYIDIGHLYWEREGKALPFVPFYVCPALRTIVFGRPVLYRNDRSPADERARITDHLISEITRMAAELPEHRVVPYHNIPKHDYVLNRL